MAIENFSPKFGAPGTDVIVEGDGFANATAVKIGAVNVPYRIDSATQILFSVPPDAITGKIVVSDPDGDQQSAEDFLVRQPTAPETTVNGQLAMDTINLAILAKNSNQPERLARFFATSVMLADNGEWRFETRPSASDAEATAAHQALLANYLTGSFNLEKMQVRGDTVSCVGKNDGNSEVVHLVLHRTSAGMRIYSSSRSDI